MWRSDVLKTQHSLLVVYNNHTMLNLGPIFSHSAGFLVKQTSSQISIHEENERITHQITPKSTPILTWERLVDQNSSHAVVLVVLIYILLSALQSNASHHRFLGRKQPQSNAPHHGFLSRRPHAASSLVARRAERRLHGTVPLSIFLSGGDGAASHGLFTS